MILLMSGGAPLPLPIASGLIAHPCMPQNKPVPADHCTLLNRTDLHDLRDVVLEHIFDTHPQRGRRAWTAGARALEVDKDDPPIESAKDDIATVLGHRRTHSCAEYLFDL